METSMALNIRVCKKENLDIEGSVSFLCKEAFTMICVVHGRGKITLGNSSIQLQTNAVVCVKPQCTAKIVSSDKDMQLIYFQYSGGESDHLYMLSSFQKISPVCNAHSKEIVLCFENIHSEFRKEQGNRYSLVAELLRIFSHFTQRVELKESRKYHNRYLKRAIDVIQADPSLPISVNALAERVNIDRSYLYRIFKKETSLSPREYMIDYKLGLGREMLKKKNENIQSVFEKLGFSSYYLAEKKFKEKYGMTPRECQKQEGLEGKNGTIKDHQ